MAQVFHRYLGKDGKIPKPPKRTPRQEERDALNAKLTAAKVRERESIAKIREIELARKSGASIPVKVHQRYVGWAYHRLQGALPRRADPAGAARRAHASGEVCPR